MKKLLYIKIAEEMLVKIASGELKPGDKISSVRELALETKVNPKTIQKSFEYLEANDVFKTVTGEGRFVTSDIEVLNNVKKEIIENEIQSFLEKIKSYNFSKKEIVEEIEKRYDE